MTLKGRARHSRGNVTWRWREKQKELMDPRADKTIVSHASPSLIPQPEPDHIVPLRPHGSSPSLFPGTA